MIELSVIIPSYNRAERLQACLEAFSGQVQSGNNFEVIVVVDGSTDNTDEMLTNLTTPYPLKVIWQQNSGQNNARNRGAEQARGRYCLFIDDDIMAEPGLIAAHLQAHQARENVVGIGQITLKLPSKAHVFTRFYAQGWQSHYARLNEGVSPNWQDCYGGNMSISRTAFLEVGGFAPDVRRSHDIELGYRLAQKGLTFIYIPDAVGHQDERKGVSELIADAEKSGAAWVKLCRRHPLILPDLLGSFADAGRREVLLRRLLLALNISAFLLLPLGLLFSERRASKWYRFLHSYSYWRGVRRATTDRKFWQQITYGTPILMYHAFGGPDESPSRYVVPVRRFARQMAWLKWRGYHILSLEEFVKYLQERRPPPRRSLVITIDDGYADNQRLAYPILRRYNFPATIFLVSNAVGRQNHWASDQKLLGRPLLTWLDVKKMRQAGIQFGAHTQTHPLLTTLSAEALQVEVKDSRTDLEHQLKTPICLFAYPYGEYDQKVLKAVSQAGFQASCGVEAGLNTLSTPLHELRRIEISGTDSFIRFMWIFW